MHPTPSKMNPIHWTIKKMYAPMYLSEHFMTILRSNHLHPYDDKNTRTNL